MTWLRHPIAILAFTLFSGLFSLSLYSSWRRNQASGGQVALLEREVTAMTQEVSTLHNQVETAGNTSNQEKIIRDQLLMQKPGEQVMQIPEIVDDQENSAPQTTPPSPWQEWLTLLK